MELVDNVVDCCWIDRNDSWLRIGVVCDNDDSRFRQCGDS